MHLDDDEDWHTASIDLFSVVLHEAGHALELAHSDRPGAMMYPYYHVTTGLTDDDIAGIGALYGTTAAARPPPSNPPTPTPPANPPANPSLPRPSTTPTTPQSSNDTVPPILQIQSPGSTVVSTNAASIAVNGTAPDNAGAASVS